MAMAPRNDLGQVASRYDWFLSTTVGGYPRAAAAYSSRATILLKSTLAQPYMSNFDMARIASLISRSAEQRTARARLRNASNRATASRQE